MDKVIKAYLHQRALVDILGKKGVMYHKPEDRQWMDDDACIVDDETEDNNRSDMERESKLMIIDESFNRIINQSF
jgi:hypothetical protein